MGGESLRRVRKNEGMDATDYMANTARMFGRQLADNVADFVNAKVTQALALERDRHDEEIGELRNEISALGADIRQLRDALSFVESRVDETRYTLANRPHSVRVDP